MVKFNNGLIQKPEKTKINNLPEEIMFEIFTTLPAECVLDCKSVCKPWRDLVSQPSFSQIHLLHSAANFGKSFLFLCYEHGLRELYYTEYDETLLTRKTRRMDINLTLPYIYFVGSSNGLICFGSSNLDYYGPFYICNPITREWVFLPINEIYYWWSGFGYVHSTNEYKVVRICDEIREGSNMAVVQVYTLGSGIGWRDAGTIDINMHSMSQFAGVIANEALHWVDSGGTIVLAFYLADEKFDELPAPPPCLARDTVPYFDIKLGWLGDFLSATYCYNAGNCNIWLLKNNKDNNDFSWSKMFSFVLFGSGIPRPFVLTKSGGLVYYKYGKRQIYRYDPKASSATMDVSFSKCIHGAIPHMNTFVSLKVLGEKDTKTMNFGGRTSSSEKTENSGKLKKLQNKVRDRVEGFYAMSVKKFIVAIQKLHLPKCC